MLSKYISPYITFKEYQCPCCDQLPPSFINGEVPLKHEMFFSKWKWIREEWGKPIPISSGYRCPLHNSFVGGKALSIHQWGLALDLDLGTPEEVDAVAEIIENIAPELRMGVYKRTGTFIHIDSGYLIHPIASPSWREGARWNDRYTGA